MRILVAVSQTSIENADGREQEGIEVSCTRCDNTAEVFGDSDASVRRGCAMLRETCPKDEKNFYTLEED